MAKIRRCFTAELRKYYLEAKCYYPDHIVNLFVLFIMFVGFFKLFSNSAERPNSAYYIGFVYWFYANGIIGESSMAISSEKQSGTDKAHRSLRHFILQGSLLVAVSVCRNHFGHVSDSCDVFYPHGFFMYGSPRVRDYHVGAHRDILFPFGLDTDFYQNRFVHIHCRLFALVLFGSGRWKQRSRLCLLCSAAFTGHSYFTQHPRREHGFCF